MAGGEKSRILTEIQIEAMQKQNLPKQFEANVKNNDVKPPVNNQQRVKTESPSLNNLIRKGFEKKHLEAKGCQSQNLKNKMVKNAYQELPLRIGLCDDLQNERLMLRDQLAKYFKQPTFFEYANGEYLVLGHKQNSFDLIFLDIIMPELDGIEAAKQIRKFDADVPLVFLTTTDEFAVQSYDVLAFDYLMKPIDEGRLRHCLDRFSMQKWQKRYITIEYMGVQTNLFLNNIIYIESNLHKVIFYLQDGKSLSVSGKLDDIEANLSAYGFCRCHKSFIINFAFVANVSATEFTLVNGNMVKISRTFGQEARRAYFNYIFA